MKSVGEVMAIGRTFKEAMMKAVRSLETGKKATADDIEPRRLTQRLVTPHPERLSYLRYAFEQRHERARSRPHDRHGPLVPPPDQADHRRDQGSSARSRWTRSPHDDLRTAKRMGISDERLAAGWGSPERKARRRVRALRKKLGVMPVFKLVDTCAAEFESFTPYLYSCYDEEDEAAPTAKKKIIILGSGPNRIGQGIEFDYCCCHAAFALREDGYETIMVNCNPETVSTDYDTSDRLYFEPLTLEDVLAVYEHEAAAGADIGMIVQFGGQTPLNLALPLKKAGVPDHRHLA